MKKGKLENPLVDKMTKTTRNERLAAFTAVALIVAGISGAIISRVTCKEEKKPKAELSLKVCTPEEQKDVSQILEKGRRVTDTEVKTVIGELDKVLTQKLDCGWEPVKDLREKLNSRRQP